MLIWHPSLTTFGPSWHKVDRVANYLPSIFQKPQHIGHLDFVTLVRYIFLYYIPTGLIVITSWIFFLLPSTSYPARSFLPDIFGLFFTFVPNASYPARFFYQIFLAFSRPDFLPIFCFRILSCKVLFTIYVWPFPNLIFCQYFAFVPSASFLPAQVNAKLSKAKRKKCPSIHFTVKRFSVIYPMDTIHPGRCTWVEATMQAIIRLWISSPPLINEIAQFHRQKFAFSILAMFNFLRKKRNRFI